MNKSLNNTFDFITILGPTASGKTRLAVELAQKLNGEIISADSRQVYKDMDIGTGKDLNEYNINGRHIPYHLIDIIDPMKEYNVAQFQNDFHDIFNEINNRKSIPILCGGTGFYIKTILMDYQFPSFGPDKDLRQELNNYSKEELITKLDMLSPGKSEKVITDTKRRIIRAIEIENSKQKGQGDKEKIIRKKKKSLVLGIDFPREVIRKRITQRLNDRIEMGMIDEVLQLIKNGVTHTRLNSLGLEYKYISQYILGKFSKAEMIKSLNTAIHQFAKKQMTFFRNMERSGIKIYWVSEGDIYNNKELLMNMKFFQGFI